MSTALEKTRKLYRAADLERLPGQARYELIGGELRPMAPTGDAHGSLTYNLALEVGIFVRERALGQGFAAETGFRVAHDPDTVLAPDFAFVAKGRLPAKRSSGFLTLVPDLVLETRSPGDTKREVAEKVSRWLDVGARLVWELDPQARVLTVYRPGAPPVALGIDDALDGGDVLPGFALPLRQLFREISGPEPPETTEGRGP